MQRLAIRLSFADQMVGSAPVQAFSVDNGDFLYNSVGYLLGGTPLKDGASVELDFHDVWWSDGTKHIVPADRRTTIPMTTCDLRRAYPLGDGWWFVWVKN